MIEIEEISNPTPWKEQTFKNILSSRTLSFVIISGQNVIGFCIASKVADECHLQNISVTASLRKQGIGKYILDSKRNERQCFLEIELCFYNFMLTA